MKNNIRYFVVKEEDYFEIREHSSYTQIIITMPNTDGRQITWPFNHVIFFYEIENVENQDFFEDFNLEDYGFFRFVYKRTNYIKNSHHGIHESVFVVHKSHYTDFKFKMKAVTIDLTFSREDETVDYSEIVDPHIFSK